MFVNINIFAYLCHHQHKFTYITLTHSHHMNKFLFSILSLSIAAPLSIAASENAPMRQTCPTRVTETAKSLATDTPAASTSITELAPKLKTQSTRNEKKATIGDLLGSYIYDEFRYAAAHTGWDYLYCVPEIIAGDTDDEVILNGFWADFDNSYNPPRPISSVKAKFDYDAQTLTIPAGTSLGKYGDYPAYIYVSDWATDKMLPDPIVLKINADDRSISYYCDRTDNDWNKPLNCLIVTSYPAAVGEIVAKGVDFIGAIVMNKYNEYMTVTNITSSSHGLCPIYLEEQSSDSFTIYNLGGCGYDSGVTFDVDLDAGTCKASPKLWRANMQVSDTEMADINIAATDGGDIIGTVSPNGNGYSVTIPSWALYDTSSAKPYIEFGKCSFDITTPLAAIGNVATEQQSGTTRLYNIDGTRAVNPRKGSMVIEVTDGKARKVIIQ